MENFDNKVHMNRAPDSIKNIIKTLAKESPCHYEWKHHKPLFDIVCSKLLDQRKQAKLQWLKNPNKWMEIILTLQHVKVVQLLGWGWREYLKEKINQLANIVTIQLLNWYRGTNEFKKGYQLISKLVKETIPTIFWRDWKIT